MVKETKILFGGGCYDAGTSTASSMSYAAMTNYQMQRNPEKLSEMTPQELYQSSRLITGEYRQKVPEFEKFCEDVIDKELNRRKDFTTPCKQYYRIETVHMTYVFHVRDLYVIEDDKRWWKYNKHKKNEAADYHPVNDIFNMTHYIAAQGFKYINRELQRFDTSGSENFQLDEQTLFGFDGERPFITVITVRSSLMPGDFYYDHETYYGEELTEEEWNAFTKTLHLLR